MGDCGVVAGVYDSFFHIMYISIRFVYSLGYKGKSGWCLGLLF